MATDKNFDIDPYALMSKLPDFVPSADFTYTEQPIPDWKFGQRVDSTEEGRKWLESGKEGWKTFHTSSVSVRESYNLLISGIVPRPVAFVSSISENGVKNLAPFSWFNQVAANPPTIAFSCTNRGPNVPNDTARNIKATKGFTVNIISEPFVTQANSCNVDAPPDVGEWPLSGLTQEPSVFVNPPRVRESAFSIECELLQAIDIINPTTGAATATHILGTVKVIHVRNDVYDPVAGTADPAKLKPIARMGGTLYGKITEGYSIPRTRWVDTKEQILQVTE